MPWRALSHAAIALAPLLAFAAWRMSWIGAGFDFVESNYFSRGLLSLGMSFVTWSEGLGSLFGNNSRTAVYYGLEFGAIVLGLIACWSMWRLYPALAWFSLAVVLLSLTSGPAQGMLRYVLGAPAVFVALARWGRHPAFDRAWSIASILLMGMLATLFTFDLWVG